MHFSYWFAKMIICSSHWFKFVLNIVYYQKHTISHVPTIKKAMQISSRIQSQVEHPCHNFISDILINKAFHLKFGWHGSYIGNAERFVKVHNSLFYIFIGL